MRAQTMLKGMDAFIKRVNKQKKIYKLVLKASKKSNSKVFQLTDKKLFYKVLKNFGTVLDNKKAKFDLKSIYEVGLHKETGALIISNKGATLYSLSPRTLTPYITRHVGFCVYFPGLGIEVVNVGLVGNIYEGKIVVRSESACTPSFLFGSQRCNCAHQWESIREIAAYFNKIKTPKLKSGKQFEEWVQKQGVYKDGKHLLTSTGQGFILMHIDTQNGMGSGYSKNEFSFDLFSKASIRHRGEYSSEQINKVTMYGGFEAIGITPDPRKEHNNAGYKITSVILDYLGASKEVIFLTNNKLKIQNLKSKGYSLYRIKSLGEVNLAGAQEAEQRKCEFGHFDITGNCVTFKEEFNRLKKEIVEELKNAD